jgi:hypothetical protein
MVDEMQTHGVSSFCGMVVSNSSMVLNVVDGHRILFGHVCGGCELHFLIS